MHIVIAGAGFAGVALTLALLRRARADSRVARQAPLRITLVGTADDFGRGVAYGAARPEHLLNVRDSLLSVSAADDGDFARWCRDKGLSGTDFRSRLHYGEYLHERLEAAVQAASTPLERLTSRVVGVDSEAGRFHVMLSDGRRLDADRVVLATGMLPTQPLPILGPEITRDPRFILSPWLPGALQRVAPDARVLIIGTGLTMIDVVTTLNALGHRGRIAAVSRHGLLPQVHAAMATTPVELPELLPLTVRDLVTRLRENATPELDWRRVVDSLRSRTAELWQQWSPTEQARFLRHVRAWWDVHRHRLAPEAGLMLQQWLDSGRLEVIKGRLRRVDVGAGGFTVTLAVPGGGSVLADIGCLVQATGPESDIGRTQDPLYAGLRDHGLVAGDRWRLGIRTNERFELLGRDGHAVAGLYYLGPMLRAQYWEMTAVPELRQAADQLAATLLDYTPPR